MFKRTVNENIEDESLKELKVRFLTGICWSDHLNDQDIDLTINNILREDELYDISHVIIEELPPSDNEIEETEEDEEYIVCSESEEEQSDN